MSNPDSVPTLLQPEQSPPDEPNAPSQSRDARSPSQSSRQLPPLPFPLFRVFRVFRGSRLHPRSCSRRSLQLRAKPSSQRPATLAAPIPVVSCPFVSFVVQDSTPVPVPSFPRSSAQNLPPPASNPRRSHSRCFAVPCGSPGADQPPPALRPLRHSRRTQPSPITPQAQPKTSPCRAYQVPPALPWPTGMPTERNPSR